MGNLSGKGYGNRSTVFVLELPNGKIETITSNACRWEDAVKAGKYPEGTRLVNSTSVGVSNGKEQSTFVDFIYVVDGSIPSGKQATEYLLEKGAITKDQATAILNARTAQL